MEKVSIKSKIAYRTRAVMAAIRGKEISFVFSQVEKWFKGELISQKESVDITLNTYSHLLQNDLADAVNAI